MRLLLVLFLASPVWAADIQYRLSDGNVTGVMDGSIETIPMHGVVSIPDEAIAIQWPAPVGCATGNPEWSRITDPAIVATNGAGMALRSGLFIFSTTSTLLPGCHEVETWPILRALVERKIIETVQDQELVLTLNELNVAAQVRCPGATGGATCDSVRTFMSTLNASYPSSTILNNFLTQVVTLRADALAFKTAQGW